MKTTLPALIIITLIFTAGCLEPIGPKQYFGIEFKENQSLTYRFVSDRTITMDWGNLGKTKKGKSKAISMTESTDITITYTPIDVDPYGMTTIEAVCNSIKTRKNLGKGKSNVEKDPLNSLKGKKFKFTINPIGQVTDKSELKDLIKQVGKLALRSNKGGVIIKKPDLIGDFIATQWFLWDAVSTAPGGIEGVSKGKTWDSQLSIPLPMVLKKARNVTYTYQSTQQTENGPMEVITSSYRLADKITSDWPLPYEGSFRPSGTFGFFRNYRMLSLTGQGTELYDAQNGRTESYDQNYTLEITASLPMGLGAEPKITIEQKITAQRIETK